MKINNSANVFHVGDFVRVKDWDDMLRSYQYDETFHVILPRTKDGDEVGKYVFTKAMRSNCGRVLEITGKNRVRTRHDKPVDIFSFREKDTLGMIETYMLEPYIPAQEIEDPGQDQLNAFLFGGESD